MGTHTVHTEDCRHRKENEIRSMKARLTELTQEEWECFTQIEHGGCLCDYNTHNVIVAGTAYFDACKPVIQQFPKSIAESLIEKGLVREVGKGIYQAAS